MYFSFLFRTIFSKGLCFMLIPSTKRSSVFQLFYKGISPHAWSLFLLPLPSTQEVFPSSISFLVILHGLSLDKELKSHREQLLWEGGPTQTNHLSKTGPATSCMTSAQSLQAGKQSPWLMESARDLLRLQGWYPLICFPKILSCKPETSKAT